MHKKLLITLIGMLLLLIFSCTKENEVDQNNKIKEDIRKLNLTYEEKLEDYEFFWDFIYHGYPFSEVLERKGINLEEIKEWGYKKIQHLISKKAYIQFYDRLCELITNGYYAGHLYPIDYDDYIKFWIGNYPVIDGSNVNMTIKNFYKSKPGSLLYISDDKLGNNDELCTLSVKVKIIKKDEIVYLNLKTFCNEDEEIKRIYYNEIDKILSETKNYKHLIIDVSQNGGGYNEYWEYIVQSHLWKEVNFIQYGLYNENKYTKPYLDRFFMDARINKIDSKDINNFKNANTKRHNQAYAFHTSYIGIGSKKAKPRIDRKIWLLISSRTYSAADHFAGFCKATGWATVVGENTSGTGMNAVPQAIALPKSGLLLKWDFVYGLNKEGYCNDEVGTIPDIYTAEGKTALETCLDAIEEWDKNN